MAFNVRRYTLKIRTFVFVFDKMTFSGFAVLLQTKMGDGIFPSVSWSMNEFWHMNIDQRQNISKCSCNRLLFSDNWLIRYHIYYKYVLLISMSCYNTPCILIEIVSILGVRDLHRKISIFENLLEITSFHPSPLHLHSTRIVDHSKYIISSLPQLKR